MIKQKTEQTGSRMWRFASTAGTIIKGVFSFLLTLLFIFLVLGSFSKGIPSGNIAVIPISGVISTDSVFGSEIADSNNVIKWLREANNSEEIKGVILDINSPGGSPVASAEIAEEIKKVQKPVYAVIREVGASGAYWVASAADRVYAHPASITGSIGVTASHLAYSGLIADYNLTYRRLVAGKYKDAGSPFREMTGEEQGLFQQLLDKLYDQFVSAVSENRRIPEQKVREIATGWVYLGTEAKQLGLIDVLGTKQDAIDAMARELGVKADVAEFRKQPTLIDALGGASANAFYSIGKGIGSSLQQEQVVLR